MKYDLNYKGVTSSPRSEMKKFKVGDLVHVDVKHPWMSHFETDFNGLVAEIYHGEYTILHPKFGPRSWYDWECLTLIRGRTDKSELTARRALDR